MTLIPTQTPTRRLQPLRAGKKPRNVGSAATRLVKPSVVSADASEPFTLDQELEPFGKWASDSIWVPPKDASLSLAETMLQKTSYSMHQGKRWATVVKQHRDQFTHVREITMSRASIRLPEGKLLVSLTDQKDFHTITDEVPDCVQTRLQEFLDGPGRQPGVRVYYLKPLCVEVDDRLVFTSRQDVDAAIDLIRDEVFALYRRRFWTGLPKRMAMRVGTTIADLPRRVAEGVVARKRRAVATYQAKLEFQRRKTALRAMRTHQKLRTDGCTYQEMLDLTNPLESTDVIRQLCVEKELSQAKQKELLQLAAGNMPWFVAASAVSAAMTAVVWELASIAMAATPAVAMCDPAFVAEMPGSDGVVLKIGHFDEIDGVRHVEL